MRSGFSDESAAAKASIPGIWAPSALGAADNFGTVIEQQRDVAALHGGRNRFGAIDQAALVGVGKPQQNGRDIAGAKRRIEIACRMPPVSSKRGVTR
jgi:hypothetical protein